MGLWYISNAPGLEKKKVCLSIYDTMKNVYDQLWPSITVYAVKQDNDQSNEKALQNLLFLMQYLFQQLEEIEMDAFKLALNDSFSDVISFEMFADQVRFNFPN